MKLTAYKQREFELAPEGVHRARLVAIKEVAPGVSAHGEERPRIRFDWELIGRTAQNGEPLGAFQTYNASLGPKSYLLQAVRDITGTTPAEGVEFDFDTLLGVERDLVLRHETGNDGRVYCNIRSILRPLTPAESAEAQRVKAATVAVTSNAAAARLQGSQGSHIVFAPPAAAAKPEITDEDIPF